MYNLERSHWWFKGKQFLVRENLNGFSTKGGAKGRILDIGCGTGIILQVLQEFGVAYGMELSFQAIDFLKKRKLKRIICADANKSLPFQKDTFSIITCLDVLEHLDNDLALLREMVRVCKPGGYIFVTVPAFDIFWSPHDVALHHKRRYTLRKMLDHVSGFPCRVIQAKYYNSILSIPILAVRKFKSNFLHKGRSRSDFFIKFPVYLNKVLALLLMAEIKCLRLMKFPIGVSILLILKKSGEN